MSNVIVKDNESLDSALRRFKRNCAVSYTHLIVFFAFRPSMGVGILIGVIVLNLVTYYKYKGDVGQYFQCMSQVADLVEYGFRLSRTCLLYTSEYQRRQ